jgi:DNA-binding FadR family transcriptional regulator
MVGLKSMTLSQHELILQALTERDPALARSAATIHVSESERWLREYLSDPKANKRKTLSDAPKSIAGDAAEV